MKASPGQYQGPNFKITAKHVIALIVVFVVVMAGAVMLGRQHLNDEKKAGKKSSDCFFLSIQNTVIAEMKMAQLGCPVTVSP